MVMQTVEGIVVDVGWYRTTIRSFEREIFNIPNSVFSRNVVLNITRKGKEWRFYEFIGRQETIASDAPLVHCTSNALAALCSLLCECTACHSYQIPQLCLETDT